jgi:arylsulfatase A-like enzyme
MRAVLPPWAKYGLPAEENTLPELLGAAGYEQRGMAGKWHLGHAQRSFLPLAHGFTRFYGCYNGAIDYFTHEREGEIDWHHDDRTMREEGYSTDLIGAESVRFIREAPAGKPWLLYVPFNAPHSPFDAKEEDLKKYPQLKKAERAYAAMVDSMDQAVGRILAAVEDRADAANTIVLFFSDNGGVAKIGSNEPYRAAKATVYEGGTRVCAAIRWPAGGLEGGKKFGARIGYIDVLPSVLAAAGVPAPDNLDGINFLPAMRGEADLPERPWFSYIHQNENEAAQASVHLNRWKLVAHGNSFDEKPEKAPKLELYDLAADVGETVDVSAKNPEVVTQLHARLREFGSWEKPGTLSYGEGREGFVAPKDWVITE